MIKRELYMSRIRPFIGTGAGQGHDRHPPLRKVGHVGADPAGAHGVRRQPDAVYLHQL